MLLRGTVFEPKTKSIKTPTCIWVVIVEREVLIFCPCNIYLIENVPPKMLLAKEGRNGQGQYGLL